MSSVTDLVFIIPPDDGVDGKQREASHRFENLVFEHHEFRPERQVNKGGKFAGAIVYFLGINYCDADMIDKIAAARWPRGTVLYRQHEDEEAPEVMLFGVSHTEVM